MGKKTTFCLENKDFLYYHNISKDCNVDVHLHDSYEIFQACSNNIRYFIEGKAYDLNAGDIIYTNTQEVHRPTTTDTCPYNRRFIQFNPYLFMPLFQADYNPLQIFDNRKLGEGNHIPLSQLKKKDVSAMIDEIGELRKNNSPKNQLLTKLLLTKLFVKLDELYHEMNSQYSLAFEIDPRILAVTHELDQNYSQPFNLEILSKKYFMDKYYLCHLFKKNTGLTIYEYVQTKRIQKAKVCINQGVSISETSHLCGFEDYSNFYKTFKKLVRLSPTAYKKMR